MQVINKYMYPLTEQKIIKYENIVGNWMNGNISIARERVKKLSKFDLIEFADYWITNYNLKPFEVFYNLKVLLGN